MNKFIFFALAALTPAVCHADAIQDALQQQQQQYLQLMERNSSRSGREADQRATDVYRSQMQQGKNLNDSLQRDMDDLREKLDKQLNTDDQDSDDDDN